MIICHIGARSGSKGLKNKNIMNFYGKPLIAWTIEKAKRIKAIHKIIVSTDSLKIAKISKKYGAEVPFLRPKYLSGDKVSKFLVFKHSLKYLKKKYNFNNRDLFLDIDCTNPLIKKRDIIKIINLYLKKDKIDGIYTISEANKNPYFNMVEYKKNGFLKLCKILKKKIIRRQDAPKVYSHVAGVYALSPNFINSKKNLMDGNCLGYEVKTECSFDIDNNHDLKIVKYFFKKNDI